MLQLVSQPVLLLVAMHVLLTVQHLVLQLVLQHVPLLVALATN